MKTEAWRRFSGTEVNMSEDQEIASTLGLNRPRAAKSARWVTIIAILSAAMAMILFLGHRLSGGPAFQHATSEATRGSLTVTVTATGSVEPVNQVEVGSELSGVIAHVVVDHNERVAAGQIIAALDSDRLQADVLRSRAALEATLAAILEAQANVTETKRALARTQQLAAKNWKSETELDIDEAAYDRAEAGLALAVAHAREAEAALHRDQTSLSKAVIRSPIDGIVLDRKIEPGQTVAATYQTPHLFTLAEDLTRMRLHVDVDEADIGKVRLGQTAVFTVDAYSDRTFAGAITEIRLAPQTVDSVVTYEVLLDVDNTDLSLRPGMTATAEIAVLQREEALLVPNAALRFYPPAAGEDVRAGGLLSRLKARWTGVPDRSARNHDARQGTDRKAVWRLQEGAPVPILVTPGASNGTVTEVLAGELEAGTPLIVEARSIGS